MIRASSPIVVCRPTVAMFNDITASTAGQRHHHHLQSQSSRKPGAIRDSVRLRQFRRTSAACDRRARRPQPYSPRGRPAIDPTTWQGVRPARTESEREPPINPLNTSPVPAVSSGIARGATATPPPGDATSSSRPSTQRLPQVRGLVAARWIVKCESASVLRSRHFAVVWGEDARVTHRFRDRVPGAEPVQAISVKYRGMRWK
jgi:hypothetical protein